MIRLTSLILTASVTLAACATTTVPPKPGVNTGSPKPGLNSGPTQPTRPYSVAPPNAPSGPAVDRFARDFLGEIQARSIADRAEYCGYFYLDSAGQLRGTPPRRGTFASCSMPVPEAGQGIIASYHTHGAYDYGYDNEVPSVPDLISDFEFGIDGYVSTPGGRVWLVDFQTQSTRQICGVRCVYSDPGFRPDPNDAIRTSYTLNALRRR